MNSVDSSINVIRHQEKPASTKMPPDFHMDHWQEGPLNRWAFQHVSDFLTTHKICIKETYPHINSNIVALAKIIDPISNLLENLNINVDGNIFNFTKILEETCTDSIIVLHIGNIVYEKYFNDMKKDSKHLLQSVSKSILGILYAKMIDKGIIDPEKCIGHYLPELNASVFGSATIAQALDMKIALNFSEDYVSPYSEMNMLDRACGWKTNPTRIYPTLRSFLSSLTERVSDATKIPIEHGTEFQYCSATTDVLAWLISHVTKMPYSKLLEIELWIPMGAQQNANITVDSEGFAVGNGGISCTTRDMALFGQLILNDGKTFNGMQVIPLSWIKQTYNGNYYKNHWWVNPNPKQPDSNEIHARGIYGQYLWIDKESSTVIAKFSSNPVARNTSKFNMHMALFRSICTLTQHKDNN
jgi:CubicO group peptidase (beta-lactamase class C family)